MQISREVKVWNNQAVQAINIQSTEEGPWNKKFGPYRGLSKSEAQRLSVDLKMQYNSVIDFETPDSVLDVTPKYTPEIQVCKLNGH
jgi:hypothetical protein